VGKLVSINCAPVTKARMRKATDDASLRMAHHSDQVRAVEDKILAIGYFIAPRYRPEFLKVLDFIRHELAMTEENVRCINICLDVLHARFSA
jgi:hypothetical protein